MHHFFTTTVQYIALVLWVFITLAQIGSLVRAVRWGKSKDLTMRWVRPETKKDWLFLPVMVIGYLAAIWVYRWMGWELFSVILAQVKFPLFALTWVLTINRGLIGKHRLARFMRGEYSLFVRVMLYFVNLYNRRRVAK